MSGIQMAAMAAGGLPTIALTTPVTVSYSSGGFLSAITGYRVSTDSYVYTAGYSISPNYSSIGQWDTVPSTTSNYQVYASKTSGTTPTGTLGSWLSLSSDQTWELTASPGTNQTCVLSIQIRDVATSTVRATASVTLSSNAV